jgi:hypothetical protein
MPVASTTFSPLPSHARVMRSSERPRPIGLSSTIVSIPASLTRRSSSCALGTSTSGSQPLKPGWTSWISAVRLNTCSCMSTVPSSDVSSGPLSVAMVAMDGP